MKAPEAARAEGAGLYVHVPLCHRICPYCDFAVTHDRQEIRRRYLTSLRREIATAEEWPLEFDTIYLGGGTPSLLEPGELEAILTDVRRRFHIREEVIVSLEANPEDATDERMRVWRDLGVSTVSLGVQSLSPRQLKRLGRRHTDADARRAVERARRAGFETVSADLIFGLDGQEPEEWEMHLAEVVRLEPDHVSCYQLTFHEGTAYWRGLLKGVLREMDEDLQERLFVLTHEFLESRGYVAYEVSNFARSPLHRSRHNRKYWTHLPYLGIGPSAHSFNGRERWWNHRVLPDYDQALAEGRVPVAGREMIDDRQLALEEVMLRLRTREGIDLESFRRRHGVDLVECNRAGIDALLSRGLARLEGGRLRLTLRGWCVTDAIARELDLGGEE